MPTPNSQPAPTGILNTIKKLLGIARIYDTFNDDICIYCNSAIATLRQLGVVTNPNFVLEDETQVWSDLIDDESQWQDIKTYMYLKCRMIFDAPQSQAVLIAMKEQIAECEWRLTAQKETESL